MKETKIRKQVKEFMLAAEQPMSEQPMMPPDEKVRLRVRLVIEEAFELLDAAFHIDKDYWDRLSKIHDDVSSFCIRRPGEMSKVADALGDLDYVVEGMRLACGINGGPVADEIHRSNMEKFGPGSWKRESDGKQMKPPGWTPPNIEKVLVEQGWEKGQDDDS